MEFFVTPVRRTVWVALAPVLLLAACATPAPAPKADIAASPWAAASTRSKNVPGAHAWVHHPFPGKQATQFRYTRKDGRDAMAVTAVASASMLRKSVRIEPAELGHVRFSWHVPALIAAADLASRETDDSPVRVVLSFEGDRSTFSPRNVALSDLSRALTGEPMPYATLMYVWSNHRAPGSVVFNPRTDRIRTLVLESGEGRLNQWLDYERDIRADFLKVFGEPPGALTGIGIMTDSDNTRSEARAWYGPLQLAPGRVALAPPDR